MDETPGSDIAVAPSRDLSAHKAGENSLPYKNKSRNIFRAREHWKKFKKHCSSLEPPGSIDPRLFTRWGAVTAKKMISKSS